MNEREKEAFREVLGAIDAKLGQILEVVTVTRKLIASPRECAHSSTFTDRGGVVRCVACKKVMEYPAITGM